MIRQPGKRLEGISVASLKCRRRGRLGLSRSAVWLRQLGSARCIDFRLLARTSRRGCAGKSCRVDFGTFCRPRRDVASAHVISAHGIGLAIFSTRLARAVLKRRREKSASVQTHFTPFGRVELDPLGIPALGKTMRESDAFARELQAHLDRPADGEAEVPALAKPEAQPDGVETDSAADAADAELTVADVAQADTQAAAAVSTAPRTEQTREPVAEPAVEVAPIRRATPTMVDAAPTDGPVAATTTSPAATSPVPATQKPTTATALPGIAASAPARAASGQASIAAREAAHGPRAGITAAAGYRSTDKLAAQRFEAARDSVLKQITFKLQDGQSEAHIQLQPPELGALDLRLAVDAAGQTRLSVVAERPELAALLSLHMNSLTAALQAQGLSVAHAEVRSRSSRTPFTPPGPLTATADDDTALAPLPVLRARGFVSASGLDFWV